MKPEIFQGDIAIDDRGSVSFVNQFDFNKVRRFYLVENHSKNFIRAWHGHKNEGKYVYVVDGSILLGAVKIDDWDVPSKNLLVDKFILSSIKPKVLWIPPGYANGFMTLSEGAKVIFFSTSSLEESAGDDFRYLYDHWDIWSIERR